MKSPTTRPASCDIVVLSAICGRDQHEKLAEGADHGGRPALVAGAMATRGSSDHRDGIAEYHALVVAGANNMKMFGMPSDLFLRYDNNRQNGAAIGASTSSFAQEYDNFESQVCGHASCQIIITFPSFLCPHH
jgi:hypothetical protein